MSKIPWLFFLGKRRPVDLSTQADYQEVHHAKEEPKAHKNPKGVDGESLGRGPNRRSR